MKCGEGIMGKFVKDQLYKDISESSEDKRCRERNRLRIPMSRPKVFDGLGACCMLLIVFRDAVFLAA